MKLTVGNLKGGTAKTTSVVLLGLQLASLGRRVLLVDADPQGSAMDWSVNATDWPAAVTVIPWAVKDLARRIREVEGDYDDVIVDTGPEHDVILRQALLATDHLLVPVAPSPMELRRLDITFALAAEVDAISPVYAHVLLCKVRTGTRSRIEARALLTELELPVLAAETRLLESYPLAWGSVPDDVGEYAAVHAELELADLQAAAQ